MKMESPERLGVFHQEDTPLGIVPIGGLPWRWVGRGLTRGGAPGLGPVFRVGRVGRPRRRGLECGASLSARAWREPPVLPPEPPGAGATAQALREPS